MQYMIIERFYPEKLRMLYSRFEEKGRMLPEGLLFINSWIDKEVSTCYQVMETESEEKLKQWITLWSDLADFEIIPVISSAEARAIVLGN